MDMKLLIAAYMVCTIVTNSRRIRRQNQHGDTCAEITAEVASLDQDFDAECKLSDGSYSESEYCQNFAFQIFCLLQRAKHLGCIDFGNGDSGTEAYSEDDTGGDSTMALEMECTAADGICVSLGSINSSCTFVGFCNVEETLACCNFL